MTAEQERNFKLGERMTKALEERHFGAYYCQSAEIASKQILSLIPKGCSVSWGGSMTLQELGITEKLKSGGWNVIDRSEGKSDEEKLALSRAALSCDTYICGANAMTEDGEIVEVDGNGNRVAALAFGPRQVIVVCGMNKVVKTIDDAVSRARNRAAPINAQRFDLKTPCKKTGSCADCKSADSICSIVMRVRLSRPAERIKVVLVGETLGF